MTWMRLFGLLSLAALWVLGGSPAAAKATLVLGFKGTHEDYMAVQELVEEFNQSRTDIEASVTNMAAGGSWIERLSVWFAAGTPPDVIKMEYQRSVGYVAQGLVQPLDPFIARDSEFDLGQFFPIAVAAHTFGGQVYALPQEAQPFTIFINKTHLDRVGLDMPSIDWTVDDLLEAAKKGTIDSSGDGVPDIYGWAFDTSFTRIEPFLRAFGGQLLADDLSRFVLDSPESVEALQFLHDAIHVHGVRGGNFLQRNVLIYSFGGPWSVPQYRRSLPDVAWDILPAPGGPGGRGTTLGSDGYYIASDTQYPDAAWELVKFITSEKSLERLMQHGTILPARSTLVDAFMQLHGEQPPENLAAYMKGIEIAFPTSVFPNFVQAEQLFIQSLNEVWNGNVPVRTAVENLVPQLNNYLR